MQTRRAIEIVVMGIRGCRVCDGTGLVEVSPTAPTGDCPRCREPGYKYRASGLDPDSQAEVNAAIARLEADARALKAVRVLDAWAKAQLIGRRCVALPYLDGGAMRWRCAPEENGCYLDTEKHWHTADSADAARIAAAEALIAEDPSLDPDLG